MQYLCTIDLGTTTTTDTIDPEWSVIDDDGTTSICATEWSIVEDVTPGQALQRFKEFARWKLGAAMAEEEVDTQEYRVLQHKVNRFAEARRGGCPLQFCHKCQRVDYPIEHQVCNHCLCIDRLSHATTREFLWSNDDGRQEIAPPFYGVPHDLRDDASLKDSGNLEPGDWTRSLRCKFTAMKNLDRIMQDAYAQVEPGGDEYHEEDLRQYEEVNVLDAEDIEELMALEQRVAPSEYYKEPFEVILDSGAGEHVANNSDAPGYSVVSSKGSRVNQNFIGAGGHKMANRGEMALSLRTAEGKSIDTTFQVADVTRPLWSVARICDAGFEVTFSKTGARVVNAKGKTICTFKRVGNLYKIKLDLKDPTHESFTRRGPR